MCAGRVARKIAELAERHFLVAGLVARGHGLHDEQAADPAQLSFDATVDSALAGYLDLVGPVAGSPASQVLTGLAFAEAPGLPARLWHLAIGSICRTPVPAVDLARFARSSAANFLVESGAGRSAEPVFRLFHQALNDAVARGRAQVASRRGEEQALTRAGEAAGLSPGEVRATIASALRHAAS